MASNIYKDDDLFPSKIAATGIVAGIGYAGYKAVSDGKAFDDVLTKVYNKIAPVTKKELGDYDKMVVSARGAIDAANSLQRRKSLAARDARIRRVEHNKAMFGVMDYSYTLDEFNDWMKVSGVGGVANTVGYNPNTFSLSNQKIGNMVGGDIRGQFMKHLNDYGSRNGIKFDLNPANVQWGDASWDSETGGTWAKIRYSADGNAGEMKFNFGVLDEQSGGFVTRTGRQFKTQGMMLQLEAAGGALSGGKLVDPNTYKMMLLQDKEMLNSFLVSKHKDLAQLLPHMSRSGEDVGKELLKFARSGGNFDHVKEIVSNMRADKKLKIAMNILDTEQSYYHAMNNPIERMRLGSLVTLDPYALQQIEKSTPGLMGIASDVFSVGSHGHATGAGRAELYKFMSTMQGYGLKIAGAVQGATLGQLSNRHRWMKKFLSIRPYASQTQTAEGTMMAAGGMPYAAGAEALKSVGGNLFSTMAGKLGFLNYGIWKGATTPLRAVPNVITDDMAKAINAARAGQGAVTGGGIVGTYDALTGTFGKSRGGVINVFGSINFAEHANERSQISLSHQMYKKMKIRTPATESFDKLLTTTANNTSTNDQVYAQLIKQNMDTKGRRWTTNEKVTVSELFNLHDEASTTNKFIQNMGDGDFVFLRKGTKLGFIDEARQAQMTDDMKAMLQFDGNLASIKADFYMNRNQLVTSRQMSAGGKGFTLVGEYENSVGKLGVLGMQTRSTAHRGVSVWNRHMTSHALGMTNAQAGEVIEAEFGAKLFAKMGPQINFDTLSRQKEASSYMQFMQEQILGHVHASAMYGGGGIAAGDIKIKASAKDRFFSLLSEDSKAAAAGFIDKSSGEFNLTEMYRQTGNVKFTHAVNSVDAYAAQMKESFGFLGAIRKGFTGNTPRKISIGAGHLTEGRLANYMESLQADISLAEKVHKEFSMGITRKLDAQTARRVFFPIFTGLTAVENPTISQGAGLNDFRISSMYAPHLLGKPAIAGELAARSKVNVSKLTREKTLFQLSLQGESGRPQFEEALNEYQRLYGKVNVLTQSGVTDMLGGEGFSMEHLRSPEMIGSTFLSQDKNKFGALVQAENGEMVYMPSAEAFGYSTFLPKDGKMTFQEAAASMWRGLLKPAAENGGYLPKWALQDLRSSVGASVIDMFEKSSYLTIPEAAYAAHMSDARFIDHAAYNSVFNMSEAYRKDGQKGLDAFKYFQGIEGGVLTEAENTLGQSATISRSLAEDLLRQEISTVASESITGNTSMAKVLKSRDKMGTFFDRYSNEINAIDAVKNDSAKLKEGTNKLLEKIVGDQEAFYKQVFGDGANDMGSLRRVIVDRKMNAAKKTEEIKAIMDGIRKNSMTFLVARDPIIYGSSVSAVHGLISPWLKGGKNISLGHIAARNLNTDYDGDKWKIMMMYNNSSRQEAHKVINAEQKYTAEFLRKFKEANLLKIAAPKVEGDARRSVPWRAFAEDILKKHPAETAMGAFMTKAVTGSTNREAYGMKGALEAAIRGSQKHMSEDEIRRVRAWTQTIPSLFTEQEVISSKHFESLIGTGMAHGGGESKVENLMNWIGSELKAKDVEKALVESGGTLHPFAIFSAAHNQGIAGKEAEWGQLNREINTLFNLKSGLERVTRSDFNSVRKYLAPSVSDAEWSDRWTRIEQTYEKEGALLESGGFKQIANAFEGGVIGMVRRGHLANKSSNLAAVLTRSFKAISSKIGKDNVSPEMLLSEMYSGLFDTETSRAGMQLFGSDVKSGVKSVGRSFIGWEMLKKELNVIQDWVKVDPVHRIGGAIALGLAGLAGINLMSGDGTPTDPRDLPSVNNPSFGQQRGYMMDQSSINSYYNYNSSGSLSTSGSNRYRGSTSRFADFIGMSGYNTVSVKSDGTNPYSQDMHYHTGH